jgi:hypothetical protein
MKRKMKDEEGEERLRGRREIKREKKRSTCESKEATIILLKCLIRFQIRD